MGFKSVGEFAPFTRYFDIAPQIEAFQQRFDDTQGFFPQQLLTHYASSSLTDRGRQEHRYCSDFVSSVEEALRLSVCRSTATVVVRICIPER